MESNRLSSLQAQMPALVPEEVRDAHNHNTSMHERVTNCTHGKWRSFTRYCLPVQAQQLLWYQRMRLPLVVVALIPCGPRRIHEIWHLRRDCQSDCHAPCPLFHHLIAVAAWRCCLSRSPIAAALVRRHPYSPAGHRQSPRKRRGPCCLCVVCEAYCVFS